MQTGPCLRQMFVAILANTQPSCPTQLWHLFKKHLCDDLGCFLSHWNVVTLNDEVICDYSLYLIQMCLL